MSENTLLGLVGRSINQDNPIIALTNFLEAEERYEKAREVEKMHFVGYVLELGFDAAKIITSDTYKMNVGGIPRGSFLIMSPSVFGKVPPHFTLLRVKGASPTPLSNQVQQTYFELHKKSMPELDVWTQSELQWGALDCDVLGMFYPSPSQPTKLEFSGDVNNIVSAHKYKVYAPNAELLNLIVNGTVTSLLQHELGYLRTMECQLSTDETLREKTPTMISMVDFKGRRTAMFGKTRLGKSNVVKIIAQGMIDATKTAPINETVGQLIFDINGEYANDNEQNKSLKTANPDRCEVYALTQRPGTPSRTLRLNFYEFPESAIGIIASKLAEDGKTSDYIRSFASVALPSFEDINSLTEISEKSRAARKIMMFWAILSKAGSYAANEHVLAKKLHATAVIKGFDPHFNKDLRAFVYGAGNEPEHPVNLASLQRELVSIGIKYLANPTANVFLSNSGDPVFDADSVALLKFLSTTTGSGPVILRPYHRLHDKDAGRFSQEILKFLDEGKTVILDLGNETDEIRRYFSNMLSVDVFRHQETKFVDNILAENYIQLYFEEAHNLFPVNEKDFTGVYTRFAKEGAKFHIGMVYSTQSPSTINKELLAQTENFFVGHLSSRDEARALSRLQIAYEGVEEDILHSKTVGYMRMLTMSNRFVIPVQAKKFEDISISVEG